MHGSWSAICFLLTSDGGKLKRLLDPNRQQFLDAKFHDVTLSILKGYIAMPNPTTGNLKVAKTAVGALLNSCFSFGTVILPSQGFLFDKLQPPHALISSHSRLPMRCCSWPGHSIPQRDGPLVPNPTNRWKT
jgi:hypothetical protein